MRINLNNDMKLNDALCTVQHKRINARCISRLSMRMEISHLENRLSRILFKKDWRGLVFRIDIHASNFPNAYKGTPDSTHFTVERGASGWFVTWIGRNCTRSAAQRIIPANLETKSDLINEYMQTKFFNA